MKEFERDSKLPFWEILGGVAVACFATWYAVHSVWGMCGHAGFDWCGHEASMMFKAARGSIVLSAMLSGGLARFFRLRSRWLYHRDQPRLSSGTFSRPDACQSPKYDFRDKGELQAR